ncbi:putative transferase family protein [Diaporthe ampelina]|uniref:Putative transferase family protein n=1 Tax=Diaporthe ampelina TaxID=1214573 RepID=A0A0G2FU58_9PEZI|nr:putative transferase family protein [Diaporthe ampelina]
MAHTISTPEISLLQASYAEAIGVAKEALVDIVAIDSDGCPTPDSHLTGTRTFDVVDLATEPAEEVFNISLLDCIMPKIYIPITCTYQIKDDVDIEAAITEICSGLKRLLADYRFLAGSLFETDAGTSFVKRGPSHAKFTVHVEDHTGGEFPTYEDLAERHFPVSELDARMLPPDFEPSPTGTAEEGNPAMLVQFNVIQGGLVIGAVFHHLLVDAKGLDAVMARWAAHTRSLRTGTSPPPFKHSDLNTPRLNSVTPDTFGESNQPVPSLKYAPNAPPTSDISASAMAQHIWHIPASKLAALKASAAPRAPGDAWVSTNDCITALMWRAVVRSRLATHNIADPEADPRPVALENSLDVRASIPGGVSAAYPGNVVMFSKAVMPLSELVRHSTFRAVAVCVRETVEKYRAWPLVQRAMSWIASVPRVTDVAMDFDVVMGLDVVATSWRVLRAYETWDFGFGPLGALRFMFIHRPAKSE